jgi:hypothetical protein
LKNLAPEGGKVLKNFTPKGGKVLKKSSEEGPYVLKTDIILNRNHLRPPASTFSAFQVLPSKQTSDVGMLHFLCASMIQSEPFAPPVARFTVSSFIFG